MYREIWKEIGSERSRRLQNKRERAIQRRSQETSEERSRRLQNARDRQSQRRSQETSGLTSRRLQNSYFSLISSAFGLLLFFFKTPIGQSLMTVKSFVSRSAKVSHQPKFVDLQ